MECNKDEALRAKQIAESKMQSGDFVGALKFATKAQKLFPDTQNITQVITVCEVHCAAQNTLPGSQMNWYEILKADRLADDLTIKKQYRKLALLLHPDKNKFAGAEAAFKLIGEANRVLTDQLKRSKFDTSHGVAMGTTVPKPPSHYSNGSSSGTKCDRDAKNYNNRFNSHSNSSNLHQQHEHETFWTSCEHCNTRYQYYKAILNGEIQCQQCSKIFKACDVGFQGVPPGYTWTAFNNYKEASKHIPPKPASERNGGKSFGRGQEDTFGRSNPVSVTKCTAGVGGKDGYVAAGRSKPAAGSSKTAVGSPKPATGTSKAKESEASANAGHKRGRQSASDLRDDNKARNFNGVKNTNVQENGFDSSGLTAGLHSHRSSREKQHFTHAETSRDGDFESSPKRRRQCESFITTKVDKREVPAGGQMSNRNSSSTAGMGCRSGEVRKDASSPHNESVLKKKTKVEQSHLQRKEESKSGLDNKKSKTDTCAPLNSKSSSDTEINCPDPDFSDFEKEKAENLFDVGQFWAIYDDFHGMPRFYALVKKVFSFPPFKLQINWLEADPDDEGEIEWANAGLPVACGKFKIGRRLTTQNRDMFSHRMHCIERSGRGPCLVYPREGETWAIFKDWDIGWSSNPEKHSEPRFEYVEVLAGFDENVGIEVAYLGKVNGFVSLFQQTKQNGISIFCVPCNELYRFSHQVPSFSMTGDEGEGVPEGSFELDPAGLPNNLFEVSHPEDVKMENGMIRNGVDCSHQESSKLKVEQLMPNESIRKAKLNDSKDVERVSSIPRRSLRSNSKNNDNGKESTGQNMVSEEGRDIGHGDDGQPAGAAAACQVDEMVKTPKKREKNNYERETLNVRRSPRDLSRTNAQVDAGQSTTDKVTDSYSNAKTNMKDAIFLRSVRGSSANMKNDCKVAGASSFDFKKEKSEGRFHCGQIWAIYSDGEDKMPEIYGQIKKVEFAPDFRLHVSLLEPCMPTKGRTMSCGAFEVKKGKSKILSLSAFSHQLKVETVGNNIYEIYPGKGEIWALYKDKNHESTSSNQGRGECHIVEVLADTDRSIQVVILKPINSSQPIFKAPRIQRSKTGVVEVLREEVDRFSHQIPAFQHNGDDDFSLRGCWVLEPSSTPGFVIQID